MPPQPLPAPRPRQRQQIRRYEHDHPGSLVQVDVKKFDNIPAGGGWRFVGRRPGDKGRATTGDIPKNKWHNPKMGHSFVHSVIDDHSRVASSEAHDEETAFPATAALDRAVGRFNARDVIVARVQSDNGSAYRSHLWRPQTNRKIERSHRTMADGWKHVRCAAYETGRREALDWLPSNNQHRLHAACGNLSSFS